MSTNLAWTSPLCGHRHSNSYHICLRTCPTSSFSLLSDFDNFHNSTGLWTWRHISVLSGGISAKLAEIFNMWGVGIAAKIFYVMGQRSGSGGNGHRNLRTRYSWIFEPELTQILALWETRWSRLQRDWFIGQSHRNVSRRRPSHTTQNLDCIYGCRFFIVHLLSGAYLVVTSRIVYVNHFASHRSKMKLNFSHC